MWMAGDHQGVRRQRRGQVQGLLPGVFQNEMKMSQQKRRQFLKGGWNNQLYKMLLINEN